MDARQLGGRRDLVRGKNYFSKNSVGGLVVSHSRDGRKKGPRKIFFGRAADIYNIEKLEKRLF